jgi:hypothetical protein
MDELKSEIPLLELKLPETGYTVYIKSYLTIGQSRELQNMLLEEGKFNPEIGKIENLSTKTFLKMQDKAAEFLLKEIKDKNGVVVPFSASWLYNLPVKDGTLVYDKINIITQASTLPTEGKKK